MEREGGDGKEGEGLGCGDCEGVGDTSGDSLGDSSESTPI